MRRIFCSACLLGMKCRYDGSSKLNSEAMKLARKEFLIPICPEQIGGLPTPREASEQKEDMVVTESGLNVTANFLEGARGILYLAKLLNVKEAILKQKSPSCGCGQIPDGTFSGKIIQGDGVTTTLLKKNGVRVISEDDITAFFN